MFLLSHHFKLFPSFKKSMQTPFTAVFSSHIIFRVTCTTFSASPFLVGSSEPVNQASSKWLIISSGPVPGPIRLLSRFSRM